MTQAFGVETKDIVREQHVALNVKRKGYLDALFGDLVFEFKKQLGAERHRDQLRDYLRTLSQSHPYIGILTDALKFEVYILDGDTLRQTDSFDLETTDPETAFVRLDSYLFSQTNVEPTSDDIVKRFGGNSPTFQAAFRTLSNLLAKVNDQPALAVWRGQWGKLLSKVYGSEIGDDDLFLRHTYLSQFAKLLAYAALRGLPGDNHTVEQIINGEAFYGEGVSNIGEHDFFSWVLLPEIKQEAVTTFRRLAEGLVVYDLKRIDQDLLKQLYQNLVDPATRHDLGEFYTPDWLAELTLQDIDYHYPQSLLDPACGSGSFLFAAIKRLAAQGLTGWELVRFAVDNVMGMDVHPLAVIVARINYLLALSEHIEGARQTDLLTIPVYMADALTAPELESKYKETLVVPVDDKRNENFFIPVAVASSPDDLTDVINEMHQFARRAGDPLMVETYKRTFEELVRQRFANTVQTGVVGDMSMPFWLRNLSLLTKLIREERNGIWAYILNNLSRPLVLAEKGFNVVAGNPPWLSYRYIRSPTYQKEVKRLYQYYSLIETSDANQVSNMDLSTLFFVHARQRYLKPDGTIAFVMPRSVITGAKQHRPFQQQGFTRVIDLLGVYPLFNVPTCVLILDQSDAVGTRHVVSDDTKPVPAVQYSGQLRAHEMNLNDALPTLSVQETSVQFVDSEVRSPYYYEQVSKGANLSPRTLCYVKPEGIAASPAVVTDSEVDRDAKVPWKGIRLHGVVEDDYIYATLLSKHLISFGYEKLHLVALPARIDTNGKLKVLSREMDFAQFGHFRSFDWFQQAQSKWDELKKDTTPQTFVEWLNYLNKLTNQSPRGKIRVLYNETGTHLASCVIDTRNTVHDVYGRQTKGFIVDTKTYYYEAESLDEAYYLCALLNAPFVDNAIKVYQSQGSFGERDIHRRPFEACAIPPFDSTNADHLELAHLSQQAHSVIEALKAAGGLSGGVVSIRRQARAVVSAQLEAIDEIARRILNLETAS